MSKLIPIACLASLGTAGYAAASSEAGQNSPQATSAHANRQDSKIQQVTLFGTRAADDTDMRRLPTASDPRPALTPSLASAMK